MQLFLRRQWFLVALAAALAIGFFSAEKLEPFAKGFPVNYLVASVLFLMSWSLGAGSIIRAVRRPTGAILGFCLNAALVPLVAWVVGTQLAAPLHLGLLVTAAVPCTLASAAVWTRRAGGNDAVALVVTMASNFSCFLITPAALWLTIGRSVELPRTPQQMILWLFTVAVLPMTLGQLLRLPGALGAWATRKKMSLGTICQIGILTIVLIGATKSGLAVRSQEGATALGMGDWAAMILAVVVVHVSVLLVGFAIGRLAQIDRRDWIAAGIAGSQKTLMVGLLIAIDLDLNAGILVMVAYHAVQLLIDTVVADRLARDRSRE